MITDEPPSTGGLNKDYYKSKAEGSIGLTIRGAVQIYRSPVLCTTYLITATIGIASSHGSWAKKAAAANN